RPTDDIVDVLIIGAGASGAAVAWSLAETRMKILCLEQGDWIKPTEFPSNGRDWEARRYADFDISPNRRARDTDYPVNDDNWPMNQLGWHWWPSDVAVATTEYDGRGKCINLGHCTPGCAQGAKASVDITCWPHALRARVELRTRCRIREITTDDRRMASGAIYY